MAESDKPLAPPPGYDSWLSYAVATMSTRDLANWHAFTDDSVWPEGVTREQMRQAAHAELAALKGRGAQ